VRLKINGQWREVETVSTLGALLDQLKVSHQAIGVLRNGEVVAREAFGETPVAEGDELEIVRFVGGG
jgi:thiamine biosynthesis protein ThiS